MKTRKRQKPEIETKIESMSHDGRGIAHINGKTTFISGALSQEEIKFRYKKRRGNFDEGFATEILTPSPERIAPKCQHFEICGGCSLQHIDSSTQINLKEKAFLEQLQHTTNTTDLDVLPILSASAWGYRKKARLGVKYVEGKHKVLVGFREKNSSFIANLLECEVLDASVGKHLTDLSEILYTLEARDKIPQIEVAVDDSTTALIIRHLSELNAEDISKIKHFAEQQPFKIYLQPKGMDSIHLIYPENESERLSYSLKAYDLTLEFHPSQFTQVNSEINELMIPRALELLEINKEDRVLDLFCGIGNFTLPLATQAKHVVGVEGDDLAVTQAKANAKKNALNNTEFYTENLFEPPYKEWSQAKFNKVLLDPPRTGAKELIPMLKEWQPSRIVYVSCNPSTLARDAKLIIEAGYILAKAGVMDMFPHTQHVESMALFVKK